ncbi:DUF3048 domain-containing protein [uncultured Flavonifractor sp.]|uniref:DUF3048 domain-containing protein n=1 Tax=uncultured Flavonifractor sp. TaxID=1193534 RepID=UPI00260E044A|nr:DUF3048 domain-containing protein [uncultured Flavonifractor sp.]
MRKMRMPLLLVLILLLSACGGKEDPTAEESATPESSPTPTVEVTAEPTPTPYDGPVSPLSGLPIGEEWVNRRPVAVMLNNLKEALPQLGQSQADIIYEVPAEGGITRMLGVYQSLDGVGKIGSIRSARPYYLELALGHDAVFIHAGGSEDAYAKISQWGVAALDGVRGPYMSNTENGNLMWRDPERRKSYSLEHTVVTTGEAIIERFAGYTNLRQEHEEGYVYEMAFTEDGTPASGSPAAQITVPFSNYKTGTFTYDAGSGLYLVEEYGSPYIDGNTGAQVGVTNVVVIKTACRNTGDSLGHITVDLSSGGTGYFACGGKVIDLTWSKSYPDGQLHYKDLDGNPITFGVGHTYVCVVPLDSQVSF